MTIAGVAAGEFIGAVVALAIAACIGGALLLEWWNRRGPPPGAVVTPAEGYSCVSAPRRMVANDQADINFCLRLACLLC